MAIIIAEACVNHNGSVEIAKKMIDIAVEAGVDYFKFQSFTANTLVCKQAEKAEYQKVTTTEDETHYGMIKKLELDMMAQKELVDYCHKKNIKCFSTPFDEDSIDLLYELGMTIYKIPSGEITNLPYLEKIAKLKQSVILSTGMSTLGEVENAISVLGQGGTTDISLLHCTTEYPAPFEDVNLRAMLTLKQAFDLPIGYSDHTKGIEVSIAAVAMGATIIEKHFTLDKNMEGPDHKASLNPEELNNLVSAVRNVELALGNGVKRVSPSEAKNMDIARKSIVAKEKITKGDIFTIHNITTKRPGNGISPMKWYEVLGSTATRDYDEDELI